VSERASTSGLGGDAEHLLCYRPDPGRLGVHALKNRSIFRAAAPFPHVVFDGLFPDAILDQIVQEAPARSPGTWTVTGSGYRFQENDLGMKMSISRESALGPATRNFMLQLNSITFLHFIEMLTGNKGLVGDPSFRGGGLHSTGRGGRLLVHADVERHPLGKPFCQMVNMITFLNRDWPESYGGNLELWSRDGSQCVTRISPVFNRTIIFESGTDTFHGHPQPLTCPPDRHRLSLATYFYKLDRPVDASYSGFQREITWIGKQELPSPKSESK
jgi:Rps23 Pro-64 3,4-dihydroxylase Tpa1-like proline 4-hydroxylase